MQTNDIVSRSERLLEYPKILGLLAERASSDGAKAMALALRPEEFSEDADRLQSLTAAAVKISEKRGSPSFRMLKDVSPAIARVELGGVLSMRELLEIKGVLSCARSVRDYYFADKTGEETTPLDLTFELLRTNRYFEEKIGNAILSEDEMADNASPELLSIRRGIAQANARIREILNKMITSPSYSKVLQENIITMRGGRYVIPVKNEHRGDVQGLVHDVSSSGQTVFIEPMGVVNANNEIQTLLGRERKEIERILYELSNEAAGFSGEIASNYRNLVLLDFTFAKARLAWDMEAFRPLLSDEGETDLIRARHPLIPRGTVVPVDIRIGKDFDTLVITGPNTGGKTVSLKTLGLLTLMAASGLFIPAAEGSRVRVFRRVFADIGDEQSIEQSLSTFSSHMTNITSILGETDGRTLAIFDELGAGTDPVEGAALAISIIEECRARGAQVAATTHYAELKVYALKTEGVENASCEFDVATLRPTYRLLIGIPGRSNAFAIAKRLGLEERIIENARDRLAGENVRFEEVLDNLEKNRQEMEREKARAEEFRREAEELSQKARSMESDLRKEKEKLMAEARREADRLVEDTRAESGRLLAELSSLRDRSSLTPEEINAARAMTGAGLNKMKKNGVPEPPKIEIAPLPRDPAAGDTVEIVRSGVRGTVLGPADGRGNVRVKAGIMTLTVNQKELRFVDAPKVRLPETPVSVARVGPASASMSLDLRGMASDEALIELGDYLDDAARAGLTEVTVIHGKGTGKLRDAVQNELRHNKLVKSFRLGKYGEGEAGVTVVTLA
ncbi:MAG: endonuclease MutS2 [Clostridia bacterium]|nr:endonuclease MutS2 [Clostridia bacterium]